MLNQRKAQTLEIPTLACFFCWKLERRTASCVNDLYDHYPLLLPPTNSNRPLYLTSHPMLDRVGNHLIEYQRKSSDSTGGDDDRTRVNHKSNMLVRRFEISIRH